MKRIMYLSQRLGVGLYYASEGINIEELAENLNWLEYKEVSKYEKFKAELYNGMDEWKKNIEKGYFTFDEIEDSRKNYYIDHNLIF